MQLRLADAHAFRSRPLRRMGWGFVAGLCLIAAGCNDTFRIIVRLSTIVYADGGLTRTLSVNAEPTGEMPEDPDWLRKQVGLSLAEPRAWDHIDDGSGWLRAEGFFPSSELLPPMLAFKVGGAQKSDRVQSTLSIEERTVMRRWVYAERHGDPFGDEEVQQAVGEITEMIVELFRSEIPRQLGDDFDRSAVERYLRGEVQELLADLFDAERQEYSKYPLDRNDDSKLKILARRGIDVVPVGEDEDFLEAEWPALERWTLTHLADAQLAAGVEVSPEMLRFWPPIDESGESAGFEEWWEEIVDRVWGGQEAFEQRFGPAFAALPGYFEAEGLRMFRFESRVRLPGVLLTSNGTPDGDCVLWLLRDADLTSDRVLAAESVELIDDSLRRIGARRSFDKSRLIRLHDLLWKRDPQGVLADLLETAVAAGSLDPLRDSEALPAGYRERSLELANLLDPAVATLAPD